MKPILKDEIVVLYSRVDIDSLKDVYLNKFFWKIVLIVLISGLLFSWVMREFGDNKILGVIGFCEFISLCLAGLAFIAPVIIWVLIPICIKIFDIVLIVVMFFVYMAQIILALTANMLSKFNQ